MTSGLTDTVSSLFSISFEVTSDAPSPAYFGQFLALATDLAYSRDILEHLIVTASSGSESLLVASRAALDTHTQSITGRSTFIVMTVSLKVKAMIFVQQLKGYLSVEKCTNRC